MNTFLKGCIAAMVLLCLIVSGCVTNSEVGEEAKAPNIHEYFELDQEPEPLNMGEVQMSIGYPKEAMDNNIQGVVVMRVLVGEEGEYIKHEVIQEESPILMEAINEQIENLKFNPGIKDGKSVSAWVNIPFNFKLLGEDESSPSSTKPLNYKELAKKIGYPEEAKNQGIEGIVMIRIEVDKDGNYLSHEVIKEGHALLLEAVEEHIEELKFTSSENTTSVVIPFSFQMVE
ncbi:MAG: TonB family protein [Bacteroidota bacterium]